jgi:hypothetical protein
MILVLESELTEIMLLFLQFCSLACVMKVGYCFPFSAWWVAYPVFGEAFIG